MLHRFLVLGLVWLGEKTAGWKTVLAASGLIAVAVVEFVGGNYEVAATRLLEALGFIGLRTALAKAPEKTAELTAVKVAE